jgi:hypothetical protein
MVAQPPVERVQQAGGRVGLELGTGIDLLVAAGDIPTGY